VGPMPACLPLALACTLQLLCVRCCVLACICFTGAWRVAHYWRRRRMGDAGAEQRPALHAGCKGSSESCCGWAAARLACCRSLLCALSLCCTRHLAPCGFAGRSRPSPVHIEGRVFCHLCAWALLLLSISPLHHCCSDCFAWDHLTVGLPFCRFPCHDTVLLRLCACAAVG
jgi:hypothetical protein